LVASIFAAALLFAAGGVASSAAAPGDDNGKVVCTGTLSPDGNTCTITPTNSTSPGNDECSLFSTRPDVTQRCTITQKSDAGNNHVRVRMKIVQEKTALPFVGVCPAPLRSLPLSNQNACQILTVTQTSDSGSNSLNAVLRIIQENDERSAQRQNAGQQHTVDQCSGSRTSVLPLLPCVGPGTNLAKLRLFQTQEEEAEVKAQQFQRSTANGHFTQNSAGISRYDRKFVPHQTQEAPPGSTQIQDPEDYCCSGQFSNPGDSARDDVAVRQSSNCLPLSFCSQRDSITGNTIPTSGTGSVNLSVTTNVATRTERCSAQGGCTKSIFIGVD
jgi:hypothetical protein